jgi:carbon monoxide dehydrogenase subunit G
MFSPAVVSSASGLSTIKHFSQGTHHMDMAGEQLILLQQRHVWDALNDPQILKACIPGCESIKQVADNQYEIMLTAAVGPVKAKFTGSLTLSDIDPPNSYSLAFTGSGGAAGFGKGGARVSLSPDGSGTKLVYTATAQVGGKLAQVGSRLIDGVAKKMAEEFFARFKATLAPAAETTASEATPSQTVPPETIPLAAVVDAETLQAGRFRLTPLRAFLIVLAVSLVALVVVT